jgi:polysaccharide deacetylase 2 family uncharacterized protein YibQ
MRPLARWLDKAIGVLGSGWSMLTAGIAVGVAVVVLVASQTPPPKPAAVAEITQAPASQAPVPPAATPPLPVAPAAPAAAAPAPVVAPARPAEPQLAALPSPPPTVEGGTPTWLRNAVAVPDPGNRPLIAVVIDDVGLNRPNSARAVGLPGPVTLAYLTYAEDLRAQTDAARRAGHELLVHMAMEPTDAYIDPGPDVLLTGEPPGQLMEQLRRNLGAFDGYVGVNNHMGSRFTASAPDMRLVLAELKARGLMFLDSRTIGSSVGGAVATQLGLPFAERDVFLDNVQSADAVEARLAEVERIARTHGHAIAIGHPHDATLAALSRWLPTLEARGFALVPVSTIVKRKYGVTG